MKQTPVGHGDIVNGARFDLLGHNRVAEQQKVTEGNLLEEDERAGIKVHGLHGSHGHALKTDLLHHGSPARVRFDEVPQ